MVRPRRDASRAEMFSWRPFRPTAPTPPRPGRSARARAAPRRAPDAGERLRRCREPARDGVPRSSRPGDSRADRHSWRPWFQELRHPYSPCLTRWRAQNRAEPPQRSQVAHAGGRLAKPQRPGCLPIRQMFEVSQEQDLAVVLAQLLKGGMEPLDELAPNGVCCRGRTPIAQFRGQIQR